MRDKITFFVAVLAMFGGAARALAQPAGADDIPPLRLYGGLWLGFGGEMESDLDGPLGISFQGDDDLITTVGGQLGLDFVALKYLAFGAEFRFGGFNSETGDDDGLDRSKLIDIDFKPRLRFPARRVPLEIYLTVPIGLTIARLSDDLFPNVDLDEKVGWNLGVGGGITYFVLRRFGLNLEPIWLMHRFKVDVPVDFEADVALRQFSLLFNAVIAF